MYKRRSPHGECGLKFANIEKYLVLSGRSPHGECGLKLVKGIRQTAPAHVAPLTGSVD